MTGIKREEIRQAAEAAFERGENNNPYEDMTEEYDEWAAWYRFAKWEDEQSKL